MNTKIGEAVMRHTADELISVHQLSGGARSSWDQFNKFKRSTEIQQKRRNAIAVINEATREMTNGRSWPRINDWIICPDEKIRYAPLIVPFRKPDESEWLQKSVGSTIEKSAKTVVEQKKTSVSSEKSDKKPLSNSSMVVNCTSNYNTPGPFVPFRDDYVSDIWIYTFGKRTQAWWRAFQRRLYFDEFETCWWIIDCVVIIYSRYCVLFFCFVASAAPRGKQVTSKKNGRYF